MKKLTIILLILDIIAIFCLLLAYGPYSGFRDLFITTAMNTMNHKYLAYILYNDNQINEVLNNNFMEQPNDITNQDDINFDNEDPHEYESIYEEQILKRDKDQLYKIIEFDEKDYHVYLTVIYDASRLSTVKSKYYGTKGQHLSAMAKENDAIVAINGGRFSDVGGQGTGARASGIFISNGEIIEDVNNYKHSIIGISNKNVLTLGKMTADEAIKLGIRDAVCFGPFLIVNGKESFTQGNGGYGVAPRTAIGQRKDGIILFLTIDGNGSKYGFRGGATVVDMINIFKRYGAYNAANLDGGASTVLAINGVTYNNPVAQSSSGERSLPNAWIVK